MRRLLLTVIVLAAGCSMRAVGQTGPAAPEVTYAPAAKMPDEARAVKFQGDVDVRCLVDAKGKVQLATILSDPGMGLGKAALKQVKKYRFKPAMNNGQAIAAWITVRVGFTIY